MMPIRDRLYLAFFLYHKRYGRIICAFIEGLIIGFCLLIVAIAISAFGHVAWWAWDELHTAQQKVVNAEKVARGYQVALINCLNGGLVAVTKDELIGCEPARSFKK